MDENPYATPQSPVEAVSHDRSAIAEFPRFTTWGVLLLVIVTFSFYIPYWLLTRTKVLDRVAPENPIPRWLVSAAIALFSLSMVMSVLEGIYPASTDIKISSSLLSLISGVSFVVWAFMFRARLNALLGASSGERFWLGPVMTFFFQVLYLQYKINDAIDHHAELDARPAANSTT